MAHLAANGWRTLTFAEAVERLRGGTVPERHVVVTFDDGYRNVYTEALPTLLRHGFTATVFLVADYVGRDNGWPGHAPPMGRLPLVSWEEARELYSHGVELAAHTCTHPDLTRLAPAEAEAEVVRSKAEIEARTGAAVTTFAYPYGLFDAAAVESARRHFRGACTTRMGRAGPGDDPHALDRIDAFYFQRPALFTGLPAPLLDPYLRARQLVRDLRSS
jgi:peptidoglycan/xylan/chitin deacetylase (PgdA/CDA1 family)